MQESTHCGRLGSTIHNLYCFIVSQKKGCSGTHLQDRNVYGYLQPVQCVG